MNQITEEIDRTIARKLHRIHGEIPDNILEFVELYTDLIDRTLNLNFLTWAIELGEII